MNAVDFDHQFREAVAAMDAGDVATLDRLLAEHPELATVRLEIPGPWLRDVVGGALDGFFARPYLLWFVAEDPVRNGRLPPSAPQIARTIIAATRRQDASTLPEQLDYALQLVSWSWIAREAGVQLDLIDVLADAGAKLAGNPENALHNGNLAAAAHLVKRGAPLTLAVAACLDRPDDARRLAASATPKHKQLALVLAALRGHAAAVRLALELGADARQPSPDMQSHGTPLHHAVSSGSLEAVMLLVEAGADLGAKDTAYGGTPLGWAQHMHSGTQDADKKARFAQISAYLSAKGGAT